MCFFFSSKRRHTRYWRDWSSDVCSSDLDDRAAVDALAPQIGGAEGYLALDERLRPGVERGADAELARVARAEQEGGVRPEERRVGKECRYRWETYHQNKKEHKATMVRDE